MRFMRRDANPCEGCAEQSQVASDTPRKVATKDGNDMLTSAHVRCLICGSRQLQPLLNLSEEGTSHSAAGHNFTYAYQIITVCGACGHGQLEKYSHDCFHYYGDEDWEMYWWYALDSSAVRRLRELLANCPDQLNAACECALHRSLRESAARLWGGVTHAIDPAARTEFAWVLLEEQPEQVALKVDQQRGLGQAT